MCKALRHFSISVFHRIFFYLPPASYNNALQIAAAILLPPFRPLATMAGTSVLKINSFASTTFTNPTGTPIMSAGRIFFATLLLVGIVGLKATSH